MTITAKFSSRCGRCGNPIDAGTKVEWNPGAKAVHVACPENLPLAPIVRLSVEDAGVYVLPDGTIAKVKVTRDKARTYAMRWVVDGDHGRAVYNENNERATGRYEYQRGLVNRVAAEGRKMTIDEARAFTLRFGECVRCGRTLTDPKSIDRAIGPVCVKYFGFAPVAAADAGFDPGEFDADRWAENQVGL